MQPPVSHIKSSPVSSTEIASLLRKEFKYWGIVPKWHQSEPMWPDVNITDVQRPGESSTPRSSGDSWSRWECGEGEVKTHSAPSGRHEKRCALGPTKWCSSGYLNICCPSDPRGMAPASGITPLGAAVSAHTATNPPVRMVPQTVLYREQGQWAYAENLAHHPHPHLFLLLWHSLMETIKTSRLFMFIVFIFHISVQRSNARQHWAAAAIWSMLVHAQTRTLSHALPAISFTLISTYKWYNFPFDRQGRKL